MTNSLRISISEPEVIPEDQWSCIAHLISLPSKAQNIQKPGKYVVKK